MRIDFRVVHGVRSIEQLVQHRRSIVETWSEQLGELSTKVLPTHGIQDEVHGVLRVPQSFAYVNHDLNLVRLLVKNYVRYKAGLRTIL